VPAALRWLPKVSLIKNAFQALVINEMEGMEFDADDKVWGGGEVGRGWAGLSLGPSALSAGVCCCAAAASASRAGWPLCRRSSRPPRPQGKGMRTGADVLHWTGFDKTTIRASTMAQVGGWVCRSKCRGMRWGRRPAAPKL
jgi:hypothetical protein